MPSETAPTDNQHIARVMVNRESETLRSGRRRIVGVMGGSFNPVHIGHLMVASYVRQWGGMDEVWLSLTPRNPFKATDTGLLADSERLRMLEIAAQNDSALRVTDVELTMPQPNYSIDTLRHLKSLYPDTDFRLIIGSDNWLEWHRWRAHDEILRDFGVIVYPRPGYEVRDEALPAGASLIAAPTADISSTFVREAIASGRDMNCFLPHGVFDYIKAQGLYSANNK